MRPAVKTVIDATMAMIAAMGKTVPTASVKVWAAMVRTASAISAGSPLVAKRAPPIDSPAAAATESGSANEDKSMEPRYTEFKMLPRTAMPKAPPTSRVVSLTAEPTPAFD